MHPAALCTAEVEGVVVRARAQVSDGREALSFDWRDAMPELHPVYEQVSSFLTLV
jgi:hypothetical protein